MLSRASVDILDSVITEGPVQTTTIEETKQRDNRTVREAFHELETLGEIKLTTTQPNNRLTAESANGELTTAYRALLTQAPHIEWTELLTPALLRVCWYLDEPRTLKEIGERLDISYWSVNSALDPIQGRGMLNPSGPEYALTDNISKLWGVADAFIKQRHRQRLPCNPEDAVIEWYNPTDVVVTPNDSAFVEEFEENDEWSVTGVAAFEQYGLTFRVSRPKYHYTTRSAERFVEETAAHAILDSPGSRAISYTILLLDHTNADMNEFERVAEQLGVEETASSIIAWSGGQRDNVEEMTEERYQELTHQYGVE